MTLLNRIAPRLFYSSRFFHNRAYHASVRYRFPAGTMSGQLYINDTPAEAKNAKVYQYISVYMEN
jgi:hypothetical protein